MKKIEFGFSNEYDPNGSWQGIGIEKDLLTEAIYYGAVSFEGRNFIVVRTGDVFHVREALVDVYADGSTTLFLNQRRPPFAQHLSLFLTGIKYQNRHIFGRIKTIDDVIKLSPVTLESANKLFKLVELNETIVSTTISEEAFTIKYDAMINSHDSLSTLQRMVNIKNRTK